MKWWYLFIGLVFTIKANGQHTPLPHGMVFGTKPSHYGMMNASKLDSSMGKKTRTKAVIVGKILKVTKEKGGWFEVDATNGRIISAHFKDYNISLPKDIAGRVVIIEGVAQKQFIADDLQHFAGDTVQGKKQHQVNANPNQRLTFEVTGLMVDH
jgi:hypothetical protein